MSLLDVFDVTIMAQLNAFVGRSLTIDTAIRVLTDWNVFRAGGLGCILAWAWASKDDDDTRLKLIAGVAGILIAAALSKSIQMLFFVHPRPFTVAQELGFRLPVNLPTNWGAGSSFPSDTATVYFAVAAVIASVSKILGRLTIAWVVIVIAVPRVYLLYHWPSDIILGAVLGAGAVKLCQMSRFTLGIW